jgi:AAA domain
MPNGCLCQEEHPDKRIVLTGGPGAGKTAVLELVGRYLCRHVRVLPEAASLLFRGGFPREEIAESKRAAQRAIFHVQRELEALASGGPVPAITLCDRGTVDGLAYWPGPPEEMLEQLGTTRQNELSRYAAVIHLRTPSAALGYNHQNALRTESEILAAEIDRRIELAWAGHPRRFFVASHPDFLTKAAEAIARLRAELPDCCQSHFRLSKDPATHMTRVSGEQPY